MRKMLLAGCALALATGFAAPRIDRDEVRISNEAGRVTIDYVLRDDPAIVTFSIETNVGDSAWVALPGTVVKTFSGDGNCLVPSTGPKRIVWKASRDWPNVKLGPDTLRASVRAYARDRAPKWMTVNLDVRGAVNYFDTDEALPFAPTDRIWKTDRMLLRRIPAAFVEWRMGHAPGENGIGATGWDWTQETPHRVTLTYDYYMAVYMLTQRQYVKITGKTNPSLFATPCDVCGETAESVAMRPVERVSYADAVLSDSGPVARMRAWTGNDTFNVPSAAEWEYACRAGCSHALYTCRELAQDDYLNHDDGLDEIAWYGADLGPDSGNSHGHPHAVGEKVPNAWGLYDMLGNLEERTRDWHRQDLGTADQVDPDNSRDQAGSGGHTTYGGHYGRPANRVRACCQNYYEGAAECCGMRLMCR